MFGLSLGYQTYRIEQLNTEVQFLVEVVGRENLPQPSPFDNAVIVEPERIEEEQETESRLYRKVFSK